MTGTPAKLSGQKFGKLTVIRRTFSPYNERSKRRNGYWLCLCDCGNYNKASTGNLRAGVIQSCGCGRITHGGYRYGKTTPEVSMYNGAKSRAKTKKLPFNITLADIAIPGFCPILGIPLFRRAEKMGPNSPTLDRVIPAKGYVRGNIQVISQRANVMKNDASPAELKMFAAYIQRRLDNGDF
jgi:hypothetical protein